MATLWTLTYEFELDSDSEEDALAHVRDNYDEPTLMTSESDENDDIEL